ncbi:hypothetical protein EKO04_008823 [Ascochyta lentis]|uniref:Peptidase A1 domain-containing protein n=1 Tax=Ascochyta lentis TaxID=205686 RepID=A0A8H7MFX3_9PLEO|nr:hypothetical protein EKO04_008823 [Ascochyta lentis]
MSIYSLLLALVISPALRTTRAEGCDPRVVTLPFKGQRLANQAETRGLLLGIGTPKQDLSLVLCAAHHDTYIYDDNVSCNDETAKACTTSRGGFYDRSSSTSAAPGLALNHILDGPIANWTKEDMTLSDSSSLQDFEFGVSDRQLHAYRPQAELGLGPNSSFVGALQAAGNISSKSYSFYWGDEFTDQPYDGSVIFGGYDSSVVADVRNVTKKFTQSEPTNCPEGMVVELSEMKLASESGALANIFEGLGAIKACVVPSMRNIMALHKPYGDRIIKGLGGIRADGGINGKFGGVLSNTAVISPETATFKGNLSITLESGVTITFSSRQLLLDGDPYLDSAGVIQRNASLTNIPIVVMYTDSTEMPRLGGMFFNSAYLMVNHDKSEFTIAPARATPAKSDIVGIDSVHDCVAWLNGTTLLSTSTPEQNVSTPASDSPGLKTSAIAGISVGAVAGVVSIAIIAFLFWRRRKGSPSETSGSGSAKDALVAEKDASEVFEAFPGAQIHEAGFNERDSALELDGRTRLTELS